MLALPTISMLSRVKKEIKSDREQQLIISEGFGSKRKSKGSQMEIKVSKKRSELRFKSIDLCKLRRHFWGSC